MDAYFSLRAMIERPREWESGILSSNNVQNKECRRTSSVGMVKIEHGDSNQKGGAGRRSGAAGSD